MKSERNGSDRRESPERRNGDRREHARMASQGEIRFLHATDGTLNVLDGELLDVSQAGLKLGFASGIPLRANILVELNDPEIGCLNLSAVVMWTELLDDGSHQVGCELKQELTIRQQSLLRNWVAPVACR